jgi:hypothetical protein
MKGFMEGAEVLFVFAMCLGASMTIAFGILYAIIRLTAGRQYNEADVPFVPSRRSLSASLLRAQHRDLASH